MGTSRPIRKRPAVKTPAIRPAATGPERDPGTLTLAERHLIRTPLCFLDETGTVHSPHDRFFAVGMIKLENAAGFTRMTRNWRDRHHLYGEVKFSNLNPGLLTLYIELLEGFCSLKDATFSCFVLEKKPGWERRFGSLDRVYELLARQMLRGCCAKGEILTVIADEYSAGPGVRFEEQVADWVNDGLGRLAVTQVVRVGSHAVDGIQLADLLLGSVAYDCKFKAGLIKHRKNVKKLFVQAVRDRIGVTSLAAPYRDDRFNIAFHGGTPKGLKTP
jgi:hypothetical protein